MRRVLLSVHNLGWEYQPGLFWKSTPEESDDYETPLETGIKSEKPGGLIPAFLSHLDQKCQECWCRKVSSTPCITLGLGYSRQKGEHSAHRCVSHVSERFCWFRPDYSGGWEGSEREITSFPENNWSKGAYNP